MNATTLNALTPEIISSLNKNELIEYLNQAVVVINTPRDDRKSQVLALIQNEQLTVAEIAEKLNITPKNVSSQLSYLKKDGILTGRDPFGKVIYYPTPENTEPK